MTGQCKQPSCEKVGRIRRGLCNAHYARWRRYGDASYAPPRTGGSGGPGSRKPRTEAQVRDHIRSKVVVNDAGCWLWKGRLDHNGYGRGNWGSEILAYRISYLAFVGPIPEGLELDHLCRVRRCCNPEHLEPVTHSENLRRAFAAVRRERPNDATPIELTNSLCHGTDSAYQFGCRCQDCTAAHRDVMSHYRKLRRKRLREDPSLAPHGRASTYSNWGCRCRPCTDAHMDRLRQSTAVAS